ncbi:hypothetical protein BGZ93_005204 [Podila epicladia]|nr:hypothetical protein BGZ93_005204 [Podila epicladia]
MSFPDIMMCSTGIDFDPSGFTDVGGRRMVITNISVNKTSLPMYRQLCGQHSWLTIFSTQGRHVDVVLYDNNVFSFQLAPQPNALFMNVETHTLRTDFWGYFGTLNKTTVRSVETESTSAFYNGSTEIQVFFPRKELDHRQILLTSIPSAFAAWGGWFSVVWGIFYILFGSPPYVPDADPSRRMSNSSTMTSMSSYATDSTMHGQMSPTALGDYSKMATQSIPYQTQRMVDQRFRRLERMLSEFYLNMPTDDLQEEEEEGKRGWFWQRGRRGVSPAESGKSGDEYFGVDLRGNDPYHDQIPLRGYDPRTMAREE